MTLKAVETQDESPVIVDEGPLTLKAPCPSCGLVVYLPVELWARLMKDKGASKLSPHMSSKSIEHQCEGDDPAQPAMTFPAGDQ